MSTPERGLRPDPETRLDAKNADAVHLIGSGSTQGPDAATHAQAESLLAAENRAPAMIADGASLKEARQWFRTRSPVRGREPHFVDRMPLFRVRCTKRSRTVAASFKEGDP